MPYRAKEDIGNYKEGEVVSDEDATIWKEMYKESPVEYFELDGRDVSQKNEAKLSQKSAPKSSKSMPKTKVN